MVLALLFIAQHDELFKCMKIVVEILNEIFSEFSGNACNFNRPKKTLRVKFRCHTHENALPDVDISIIFERVRSSLATAEAGASVGRFDLAAPDVAQRIRRCRRLVQCPRQHGPAGG